MDIFVHVAIFLQLLFCSVQVAFFGEDIFLLPLLGYAVLEVLHEYTLNLMMSEEEELISGCNESCSVKQAVVPVARSRLLGQLLDWKVKWPVERSLAKPMAVPTVRNSLVWSYCMKLQLPARLKIPHHSVLLNDEDVPTLLNTDVFVLCRALGLKAKLAGDGIPTVRNPLVWKYCKMLHIEARLEFPKLLKAEDVPTVHSRNVFSFCKALGLKARLAS